MRRPRSGQFSRLLHFTSANVNKANWARKTPTNVLSRNTWGRNGDLTALLALVSLFVGFVPLFVELVVGLAFPAPVFGVGGGLGVGDTFYSPLLLFASFFGLRLGGLGSVAHVRPQYDV